MVSMMSERVVTVQGLAKHFAKFTAVHELDLHLDRGEVVGFLGPNGAGKSTTMKIITGFWRPVRAVLICWAMTHTKSRWRVAA
jgi:ABC-2 type transport system ATP-binding protein